MHTSGYQDGNLDSGLVKVEEGIEDDDVAQMQAVCSRIEAAIETRRRRWDPNAVKGGLLHRRGLAKNPALKKSSHCIAHRAQFHWTAEFTHGAPNCFYGQ